jgi:hypothetical protein
MKSWNNLGKDFGFLYFVFYNLMIMKSTLLLAAIIAPALLFGQTIENIKDSKLEKVYRGFENEFQVVGHAGLTKYDYELKGVDCEIERLTDPNKENNFILRTGNEKSAAVILYLTDGSVINYDFMVGNLPDPLVKVGNAFDGGVIDFGNEENLKAEVVYPEEISLKMPFQIKSIRVTVLGSNEGLSLVSEGAQFSDQTIKLLSGLSTGEKVKVEVDILDEMQILRKKELTLIAQ